MNRIFKQLCLPLVALCGLTFTTSCSAPSQQKETPMSFEMVKSEMQRVPEGWMLDFVDKLKWNYCHGLETQAFLEVADQYPQYNDIIFDYVKAYCDTIIDAAGQIRTYKLTNFTLDHINPGKMVFKMWHRTHDPRLKTALDTLYKQLTLHPRVAEGGFWHKKAYPHQMWLDGLYMEAPFYAEYAKTFLTCEEQAAAFDDVVRQITVVARHTYNPANGLYHHAWDEKRQQFWADPETGKSAHVWGRALGWYAMSMVDALDFMPEDHPGRDSILHILCPLAETLYKIEEKEYGACYQVLDCIGREGNYLETTCSAMFIYTFLKGAIKGYLPQEYWTRGVEAYNNLTRHFIRHDEDGTISITRCCAVAGLGGKGNRSGSFEYYISEPIRDNDPKAVGPYIMASLLIEKYGAAGPQSLAQ